MTKYQVFVVSGISALYVGSVALPIYSQSQADTIRVMAIPVMPPTLKELEKREKAQDKKLEKLAAKQDSSAIVLQEGLELKAVVEENLDDTGLRQKRAIKLLDMLPKMSRPVTPNKVTKMKIGVSQKEPVPYTEIQTEVPSLPCVEPVAAERPGFIKRLFKKKNK